MTASPLWSPDNLRLWLSAPVPPDLLSDVGCSLPPGGQLQFSYLYCGHRGSERVTWGGECTWQSFLSPWGGGRKPKEGLPPQTAGPRAPRGVVGTASSAGHALACVTCRPWACYAQRKRKRGSWCVRRPRPGEAPSPAGLWHAPRLRGCRRGHESWSLVCPVCMLSPCPVPSRSVSGPHVFL